MHSTASLKRRLMVAALAAATLLAPRTDGSRGVWVSDAAAEVASGATLTVLAPPVEIAASEVAPFAAAWQGQLLQPGDVVRTGPGGLALLTFFDGSETQLAPESQIQLERAGANPTVDIALLQTAGVTTNHVVPLAPGGSFQTDTPGAVGLVRGTSYVVAVTNLDRPALTGAPAAIPASMGIPSEPAQPASAPLADAMPAPPARLLELDAPDSSGEVETSEPTAASVDEDTAGQPDPPAAQVAAAIGRPRTLSQQVSGCAAGDARSCLTSVVLLADRDGRVGRVVVAPRAPLALVELAKPGELAAVSARAAAKARLSAPATQHLQHAARDLRNASAAELTEQQVQQVVEALEPVVAPESPPEPTGGSDDAAVRQPIGVPGARRTPDASLMVVESVTDVAPAQPAPPEDEDGPAQPAGAVPIAPPEFALEPRVEAAPVPPVDANEAAGPSSGDESSTSPASTTGLPGSSGDAGVPPESPQTAATSSAPLATGTVLPTSPPGSSESPAPVSASNAVNTDVEAPAVGPELAVTSPTSVSASADPMPQTLSGGGLPQTPLATAGPTHEPSRAGTTENAATPTPTPEVTTPTVAPTPGSPSAPTPIALPTAPPAPLLSPGTPPAPTPSTITAPTSPTKTPTPVAVAAPTVNPNLPTPSAAPTASAAPLLATTAPASPLP